MNRRILSAIAIFFGSMLLFGVQPMVGRTLLPFFGGTSAVWIVCLCAFQVLLLGGYFYAHRLSQGDLSRRLKSHLAILAVAAVWAFCVGVFGKECTDWSRDCLRPRGCWRFSASWSGSLTSP